MNYRLQFDYLTKMPVNHTLYQGETFNAYTSSFIYALLYPWEMLDSTASPTNKFSGLREVFGFDETDTIDEKILIDFQNKFKKEMLNHGVDISVVDKTPATLELVVSKISPFVESISSTMPIYWSKVEKTINAIFDYIFNIINFY